jgi:hypothetical protein
MLSLEEAVVTHMGTFGVDANGEATRGQNHQGEGTDATPRGGLAYTSDEAGGMRSKSGSGGEIGPTRPTLPLTLAHSAADSKRQRVK